MKKMDKENKSHKRKELSEFERGEVIGLLEESCSERKISKLLDIPKSTVHDTIKKFSETGTTENFFQPGRPRILNELNSQQLKKIIQDEPRATASQIQEEFQEETNLPVSVKTIRREIYNLGFSLCVAAHKPLLNDIQKQNRLNWCMERRDWSIRRWKNVIWSDESRFCIFSDGPVRVWRFSNERYEITNTISTVKHGGGGVIVWECFSGRGLGPLVLVNGNMNHLDYINILETNLLP